MCFDELLLVMGSHLVESDFHFMRKTVQVQLVASYLGRKSIPHFWTPTSSLIVCHWGHCAPPLCLRLSGLLLWSVWQAAWLVVSKWTWYWNQQPAVMCRASRELVWSSASHLTLVNSSNESGLFLGGLFFIRGVRGLRTGPALCQVWEGRRLRKRELLEKGDMRGKGENIQWLLMFCFLYAPLVLVTNFVLKVSRSFNTWLCNSLHLLHTHSCFHFSQRLFLSVTSLRRRWFYRAVWG